MKNCTRATLIVKPILAGRLIKQLNFAKKHKLAMVVLLIIASYAVTFLTSSEASAARTSAYVTEVTDGDTITVAGGARVRILGINAPERGELGYKEPKQNLVELVLNREILIERDGADKDRYGRLLRHIWLGETLVAEDLARKGLVRAKYFDPRQKYIERIAAAEEEARNQDKGLWKKP